MSQCGPKIGKLLAQPALVGSSAKSRQPVPVEARWTACLLAFLKLLRSPIQLPIAYSSRCNNAAALPCAPLACSCRQPENPDRRMWQCDMCQVCIIGWTRRGVVPVQHACPANACHYLVQMVGLTLGFRQLRRSGSMPSAWAAPQQPWMRSATGSAQHALTNLRQRRRTVGCGLRPQLHCCQQQGRRGRQDYLSQQAGLQQ